MRLEVIIGTRVLILDPKIYHLNTQPTTKYILKIPQWNTSCSKSVGVGYYSNEDWYIIVVAQFEQLNWGHWVYNREQFRSNIRYCWLYILAITKPAFYWWPLRFCSGLVGRAVLYIVVHGNVTKMKMQLTECSEWFIARPYRSFGFPASFIWWIIGDRGREV